MLSHIEVPEALNAMYEKYLDSSFNFLQEVKDSGEEREIEPNTNLATHFEPGFVYIKTGLYEHKENLKNVRFYNPGDFITVHESFPDSGVRIQSEMPGNVVYFPKGTFLLFVSSRPKLRSAGMELESLRNRVTEVLCAQYCRVQDNSDQTFKDYPKGSTIIEEGSKPFAIYQLIRGTADVTVQGKTVGQLKTGEIFGETSFLMDTVRTASVITTTDSQIRIIGKENFLQLLDTDPAFCTAIATQLAERIAVMGRK